MTEQQLPFTFVPYGAQEYQVAPGAQQTEAAIPAEEFQFTAVGEELPVVSRTAPQRGQRVPLHKRSRQILGDVLTGILSGASEGAIPSPHQAANVYKQLRGIEGPEVPDAGEQLRQLLGMEAPEGFGKGAHRIGEVAGRVVGAGPATPVAALPKQLGLAAAGGALGQAAEEMDLPGWMQGIAEVAPAVFGGLSGQYIAPGALGKDVVRTAKELGMTNKQLLPLTGGRQGTLAKSLQKPATRAKIMKNTRKGAENLLGKVDRELEKIGKVPENIRTGTINKFERLASEVESKIGANSAEKKGAAFLREQVRKMAPKEVTGTDYKNMYRTIGHEFRGSPPPLIRAAKDEITGAITKTHPELGVKFRHGNRIWEQLQHVDEPAAWIAKKLDKGEIYALYTGVGIPFAAGSNVARRAFAHVAAGPKGATLVERMIQGLKEGNQAMTQGAAKQIRVLQKKEEDRIRKEEQKSKSDR